MINLVFFLVIPSELKVTKYMPPCRLLTVIYCDFWVSSTFLPVWSYTLTVPFAPTPSMLKMRWPD